MSDLLNKASLVMIPSGYKEDVVYSQIPTDGSGDLSFTRASNGTRINSAGLVEVCPWNLLEYSEQFDNGAWSAVNCSIVANDAVAPNGTTTADKFTTTSTTTECQVRASNFSILSNVGIPFTTSVYAKKGTANFLRIRNLFSTVTVIERNGWFNLNTGTLGTIDAGQTGTITDVGNGWYRCTLTGLVGSGGNGNLLDIGFTNADNTSFPTTSVYGYLWGAQLNIGSTAKPYFPTTDRLNVPRLTYQNGGGGCPSLLLEKQSTNLILQSEVFDNASWTKNSLSVTANSTTSPDGTQNADTLTADGTSGAKGLLQNGTATLTNGTVYTTSIYAKKNTNNFIQIVGSTAPYGTTNIFANFDLNSGVVGTVGSSATATITNMGNGWYRCTMTATATATTSTNTFIVQLVTSATATRGESNTLSTSVYLWGAQLEASSYPTSYIPTTSSSATRVADACFKTGISSLIGQSQGTMFVDSVLTHSATTNEYLIQVSESASNRFFIYREAGTNKLGCFARVGSTTIYTQLTSGAITGRVKAVFTYQSGSFAFYVNGTQIGVSTATFSTPPIMDRLDIDSNAGAENGYYNYNEAILFKTRLTNAELQAITTI